MTTTRTSPFIGARFPGVTAGITAGITALLGSTALAQSEEPAAVALPSPFALVSRLDFECRQAQGAPPAANVFIRQLNPVLRDTLPDQQVMLGGLEEVCVPVAKNGNLPPPNALAIARWLDLACYQASAAPVDQDVKLSHLNPVLAQLPDETVKMVQLRQLCLPVTKNGVEPPPAVKQIARHFDVACYELAEPTVPANTTLVLSHLNPVIQDFNLPNRLVEMKRSKRLCVPVAKGQQPVPPGVLPYIAWADFLKYRVEHLAGPIPFLPLQLAHLNPLYEGRPPFNVVLSPETLRLMVPVAKNGQLPPGGPAAD